MLCEWQINALVVQMENRVPPQKKQHAWKQENNYVLRNCACVCKVSFAYEIITNH